MAEDLGVSVLRLTTDSSQLNSGIDSAHEKTLTLGSAFTTTALGIAAAIQIASAAVASLGSVYSATIGRAAQYGDEMRDMSIQTGLATQTLSALNLQVQLNGASSQDLSTAFRTLAGNFSDANNGSEQAIDKFHRLGISTAELAATGGDMDAIYRLMLEKLAIMPESAEKSAVMNDLLGRSALRLKETFNQGTAGLEEHIQMVRKFGTSVDDGGVMADRFNDSVTLLNTALDGMKIQLGNKLLPVLTEVITKITNGIPALAVFMRSIKNIGDVANNPNPLKMFGQLSDAWKEFSAAVEGSTPVFDGHTAAITHASDAATFHAVKTREEFEHLQTTMEGVTAEVHDYGSTSDLVGDLIEEKWMDVGHTLAVSQLDALAIMNVAWDDANGKVFDSQVDLFNKLNGLRETDVDEHVDILKKVVASEQKTADQTAQAWKNSIENLNTRLAESFSDMILNAKFSFKSLEDIVKTTVGNMLSSFLSGLISPVTNKLASLGASLASSILGGGGGGGPLQGPIDPTRDIGLGGGAGIGGLLGLSGAATLGIGAAATAVGLLVSHFVGRGRRTANEFVQQFQNPFGDILAGIVQNGNVEDLDQAWSQFNATASDFASQGGTESTVVRQAHQTLDPLVAQIRSDLIAQGRTAPQINVTVEGNAYAGIESVIIDAIKNALANNTGGLATALA